MSKFTQFDADRINARNAPKSLPEDGAGQAFEGREAALHLLIEDELKRRRWYYVHSRTDRATTQQAGVPDFIIATPNGKTLWIEAKRKGGKLSVEQNVTRHILLAMGHHFAVVFSMEDFFLEANKASS
jgi:hypothetical protein